MKVRVAAIVCTVALAVSACNGGETPVETVTPTPWAGSTAAESTPTPTSTPTPSQEELSAMAEQTYRAFFNEWVRLQWAGGAEAPTSVLGDYAAGDYLDGVAALLRQQKEVGQEVGGALPVLRVVPEPGGDFEGVDPRLTLKVCEDSSQAWYVIDGVRHAGDIVEGIVYLGWVDDRVKVVGAETEVVQRCSV